MIKNSNGQLLVGAIILLMFIAILLPAIVRYVQNDSSWSVKQQHTTRAFSLAEGAVERGYQQCLLSTSTWTDIQSGIAQSGFSFDRKYSGSSGGYYEIRITSGPQTQQATIVGVGKDDNSNEIRAIKVVYGNQSSGNNAIDAGNVVTLGASVNVEWGAVTSFTGINSGGRTHPRFFSTGAIDLDSNGAAPSNTDNRQWWSYQTNLPPMAQIDLNYYLTQAQNPGGPPPAGCPSYYTVGNVTLNGCIDTSNRTYYATGNITFTSSGGGNNFIYGNIIALGNLVISGNGGTGASEGSYTANIPPQAWKEYANDWATYKCFDSYANAHFPTYNDALNASYNSTAMSAIPSGCANGAGSVIAHGFLYAGGGSGLSGGGNARFHGVIMTPNTVTAASSNFTIYFDNAVAAAIHYASLNLSRYSWQEVIGCGWSGTHPACP